jgi:hypothetical protein
LIEKSPAACVCSRAFDQSRRLPEVRFVCRPTAAVCLRHPIRAMNLDKPLFSADISDQNRRSTAVDDDPVGFDPLRMR